MKNNNDREEASQKIDDWEAWDGVFVICVAVNARGVDISECA